MSEVKTDSVVNVSGDNDSGIDLSTNDVVAIKTANSERLRVDASGNVGIGNTTPGSFFSGSTNLVVGSGSGDEGMTIYSGSSNTGNIKFADGTGSDAAKTAGGIRYDHNSGFMRFDTNDGSERMRIASGGQVLINATSTGSSTKLHVKHNDYLISCYNNGGTSGYFGQIQFLNNTDDGTIGSIQRVNNNSVNYNTTSDARLKENVADMTDGITRVKQLAPKRFSWIEEDLDTANQDGFLAHEAQAVVPLSATGTQNEVDDDGNPVYMQMDAAKLVPVLTAALKESIAKIETLETEMTALKARVTALEDA